MTTIQPEEKKVNKHPDECSVWYCHNTYQITTETSDYREVKLCDEHHMHLALFDYNFGSLSLTK